MFTLLFVISSVVNALSSVITLLMSLPEESVVFLKSSLTALKLSLSVVSLKPKSPGFRTSASPVTPVKAVSSPSGASFTGAIRMNCSWLSDVLPSVTS